MKTTVVLSLVFFSNFISAQSGVEAIQQTLINYINGSSYNDSDLIQSAFYEEAPLFLSKKGQEIWVLSPKEYAAPFENREKGQFNGRQGRILTIDLANNIASAKAEIKIPSKELLYIDIFLLKKLSGEWKIISKAATQIVN
ncbi:MAG: nuclear transport factor 2 family protein [Bacteroidota bacterium]